MARKRKKTKPVFMKIDEQLFIKSRPLIPNRTEDYEDYLRRKIAGQNRAEIIQMEIDRLDLQRAQLMKEYDIEIGLQDEQTVEERTESEQLLMALQTVTRVVDIQGVIGLDKIEDIANLHEVSFYELKNNLPAAIKEQVVKTHPHDQTRGVAFGDPEGQYHVN